MKKIYVCCPKCKATEFKISDLFEICYCVNCKSFFDFDEMIEIKDEE